MPKIEYVPRKFNAPTMAIIVQANRIIEEYQGQG